MTNLNNILKSKDITLPTKVHLVKAMALPIVVYGCESWTIKKPERWRIDASELWCWRRLLSLLDSKESQPVNSKGKQSWIFSGRTDAEPETPITLATWCEELTHCKRPWCWERLKAGGDGDDRGWDGWMSSATQWTWVWASPGSWRTGKPGVLQSMGSQRVRHDWATELNWTLTQARHYTMAWESGTQRLAPLMGSSLLPGVHFPCTQTVTASSSSQDPETDG